MVEQNVYALVSLLYVFSRCVLCATDWRLGLRSCKMSDLPAFLVHGLNVFTVFFRCAL